LAAKLGQTGPEWLPRPPKNLGLFTSEENAGIQEEERIHHHDTTSTTKDHPDRILNLFSYVVLVVSWW
jgi:hypothetical protein